MTTPRSCELQQCNVYVNYNETTFIGITNDMFKLQWRNIYVNYGETTLLQFLSSTDLNISRNILF